MENERKRALLESIKRLNKSLNKEAISFGDEHSDEVFIPSGIQQLDDFIGGGWKNGAFTVIYGAEASGKSTLVLQSIAHAQSLGKICCYLDLEHSFSKERAISLGINLDDLVLVENCQTAEDALNIIRGFCKDKVIDLFVLDSVQAMSPLNQQENKGKIRELEEKEIAELARLMSKFFTVVSPDVFRAKASVILIGQVRIGGIGTFFTRATMTGGEALKHFASLRLFIRRGQGADAPTEKVIKEVKTPDGIVKKKVNEPIGFDAVLKIEKSRFSNSAKEGSEIHLPFLYTKGFVLNNKEQSIKSIEGDSGIEMGGIKLRKFTKEEMKVLDEGWAKPITKEDLSKNLKQNEEISSPESQIIETKEVTQKKKRGRKPKNIDK